MVLSYVVLFNGLEFNGTLGQGCCRNGDHGGTYGCFFRGCRHWVVFGGRYLGGLILLWCCSWAKRVGVGTTFCALKYGIGRSRDRCVTRLLDGTNFRVISPGRRTSCCVIGSYAIATATSRGAHRGVEGFGHHRPSSIIVLANYVPRTFPRTTTRLRRTSVIFNGGGSNSVLSVVGECGLRRGEVIGVRRRRANSRFHRYSVSGFGREIHTFIGVRSKYSEFYSCYVVPGDENEIESGSPRRLEGSVGMLTRGNVGRVILMNVGLSTCNGNRSFGVISTIGVYTRASKVLQIHLNDLRPSRVASGVVSRLTGVSGFYPRFRVSLRDKYSGALGSVGERCDTTRCTGLYSGLHTTFSSTSVAASIVINFGRRDRDSFGRDLRFIGEVNFRGIRIFPCSRHANATTSHHNSSISGRRGRQHTTVVTTRARGVHRRCFRDLVNGGIGILFRGRATPRAFENCAGDCVPIRMGSSRGVGNTRYGYIVGDISTRGSVYLTGLSFWCSRPLLL